MKVIATIRHHSIARARLVPIEGKTLTACKVKAGREFGGGQYDHTICLYAAESMEDLDPILLAARKIGGTQWVSGYDAEWLARH